MILRDFKIFNVSGRLLGLDWGAHRTGVAISDAERKFVFARDSIVSVNADDLISKIIRLINQENIAGIIVGLPLRMDGTDSDTTAMVRSFAENLSHHTELPIVFIDETLSSASAQEQMGRIRRMDIKEKLDSNAARVILENAIAVMNRL